MRKFVVALLAGALAVSGCVERPDPEPASLTTAAPPWPAPRDAISWIEAAGLPQLQLDDTSDPWVLDLVVLVDGEAVEVPPFIGVDRLRAVQAPVHTHTGDGVVWLEGAGNREVTLAQFFHVWGVAFDGECLAAMCNGLEVVADGVVVPAPSGMVLRGHQEITVSVQSS